MNDSLIHLGGAVKAIKTEGNLVTVGGYLVTFGSSETKDFDGDWFTADTHYGARCGDGVDTIFHHGLKLPVKGIDPEMQAELDAISDYIYPPIKATKDAEGIFAEVVLDMANKYEAMVAKRCIAGKMGWSSGAVAHLVRRKDGVKCGEITRWPIGEASLTPTPADSRNFGTVLPIKSYVEQLQADEFKGLKSEYLGDYAEFSATMAMADSLFDAFRWTFLYDVIDDVQQGEIDWAAARERIVGAFGELQTLAMRILDAVMSGQSEQTAEAATKYLKAKKSNDGAGLVSGLTNAELTRALLAGAKAYPERVAAIKAQRESDNRTFPSAQKRAELEELIAALESGAANVKSLIAPPAEATPNFVIPSLDFMQALEAA